MTVFAISFVIYTIGIVLIGVLAGRHAGKDDESFFLGGRTLGPWVAALSASASSESGWLTIGLVGWAFTSGASAYWILPGVLIGYVFNWVVLAGPLRDQTERLGAITLPDYLSLRFGEGSGPNGRAPVLRLLAVAVIILAMWLYVAAQFAAAGKAFESAFAIDYRWGVGIGGAIVLFYTVIGGFRAACWTDFAQAIVMFVALGLFPIWALLSSGGYGAMSESLASVEGLNTFWPEKTGLAFMGFLFGSGALGINFGYPGQPHVLIRFIALRKRSEAVKAAVIAFTWGAVVLWGAVTLGLLVRAYTIDGAEWTAPLAEELAGEVSGAGETGLVLAAQALLPGVLGGERRLCPLVQTSRRRTVDQSIDCPRLGDRGDALGARSGHSGLYVRVELRLGCARGGVWASGLAGVVLETSKSSWGNRRHDDWGGRCAWLEDGL